MKMKYILDDSCINKGKRVFGFKINKMKEWLKIGLYLLVVKNLESFPVAFLPLFMARISPFYNFNL